MCCRKISVVFLLCAGVNLGWGLMAAHADGVRDYTPATQLPDIRSNCLESSTFPCVSLTPAYTPSYSRVSNALSSNSTISSEDAARLEPALFTLRYKEAVKAQWHALHHVKGMAFEFSLDGAGAGMNVDMGGLEFNVFVKDGDQQLLDTGFFLGFDSRW